MNAVDAIQADITTLAVDAIGDAKKLFEQSILTQRRRDAEIRSSIAFS